MQNNESNKFSRLWKDKGYYILLGLCVVAVGVSGYFFVSGALRETEEAQEVLSVPVTVEEPKTTERTPAKTESDADAPEQKAEAKPEDAADASAAHTEPVAAEGPMVVLPVSGSVTQDYAMDRLTYNATTRDWRVHNGVDLAAEAGQTVKAARAGTVAAIYEDESYGVTVVLQHDGGYASHYCNLAETVLVAAGDTVAAGDPIGTIGGTALMETASESHLHFEVYLNGEPTDPAGFLY